MADDYIVYAGQYTRTGLVLMVLDYAQISYRMEFVDLAAGAHRQPEFLAINPAGYVPALKLPSGAVMHETPAMLMYLAEAHDIRSLMPSPNSVDRASFLTGLFYCTNDIQPEIKRFYFPARYAPRDTDAKAIHAQALAMLIERFGVLEQHLRTRRFYLGDELSLVDLVIAFWATSVFPSAELFASCPSISAHAQRVCRAHPSFNQHIREHTDASERYWNERLVPLMTSY